MHKTESARRIIVVLSAGRSGTSLLMQALARLGMTLSEELLGGRYENPDGFFEDVRIVELHKELLERLETKGTLPLPDDWQRHEATREISVKLRALVHDQLLHTEGIWGFKDPRTATFLPMWLRIFNAEKVNPVFILALREPASVISSFVRLYNNPPELAELVWLSRTCDALHHTGADCYIAHYEDWFSRPGDLGRELMQYSGLDTIFKGNVDDALREVIKPNLNRSVHDPYEIGNEFVQRLFGELSVCRGAEFDRPKLMHEVRACVRAMDDFKGWYLDAHRATVQLKSLTRVVESEKARQAKQAQELVEAKAEIEVLRRVGATGFESKSASSSLPSMGQVDAQNFSESGNRSLVDTSIDTSREQLTRTQEMLAQALNTIDAQREAYYVELAAERAKEASLERQLSDARSVAEKQMDRYQTMWAESMDNHRREIDMERENLRAAGSEYRGVINARIEDLENQLRNAKTEWETRLNRYQDDIADWREESRTKSDAERGDLDRYRVLREEQQIAAVDMLQRELETAKAELDSQQTQHQALVEELLSKHQEEIGQQFAATTDAQAKSEELSARIEELLGDLHDLTSINAQYVMQAKALHDENERLRAKLATKPVPKPAATAPVKASSPNVVEGKGAGGTASSTHKPPPAGKAKAAAGPQKEKSSVPQEKGAPKNRPMPAPQKKIPPKPPVIRTEGGTNSPQDKRARLMNKLKKDPHSYFADSKLFFLRPAQYLFKKKS